MNFYNVNKHYDSFLPLLMLRAGKYVLLALLDWLSHASSCFFHLVCAGWVIPAPYVDVCHYGQA